MKAARCCAVGSRHFLQFSARALAMPTQPGPAQAKEYLTTFGKLSEFGTPLFWTPREPRRLEHAGEHLLEQAAVGTWTALLRELGV